MTEQWTDTVFKEKVRHPSKNDTWITMRDYTALPERTPDENAKTPKTTTLSTFNVLGQSYNYTQLNNSLNQWQNQYNYVDNNSVTIQDPTDNTKNIPNYLIGEELQFIGSNNTTITVTNNWANLSYDGTYAANTGVTTITDTLTPSWKENFINEDLKKYYNPIDQTVQLKVGSQIKINDNIIIPTTHGNNLVNLNTYKFIDNELLDSANGKEEIAFNYNYLNAPEITNIIDKTQNNNNINITDFWQIVYDNITSIGISKTDDTDNAKINIDTINSTSIENIPKIYGNGILLNRYNLDQELLSYITESEHNFDYNYLIVHTVINNNYSNFIIRYDSQTGYLLCNDDCPIFKINLQTQLNDNTSDGSITLSVSSIITDINVFFGEASTLTLIPKWYESQNLDADALKRFEIYKLPSCYMRKSEVINTIQRRFNNDTQLTEKIKQLNPDHFNADNILPSINRTDNNKIDNVNTSLTIDIYNTNGTKIQNSATNWSKDQSNLYKWNFGSSMNPFYMCLEISNSLSNNEQEADIIDFSIVLNNSSDALEILWDTIINLDQTLSFDNITLDFCASSISGTLVYTGVLSNVYKISKQNNQTLQNILCGKNINQFWNNIVLAINQDTMVSNKIVIYYNTQNTSYSAAIKGYNNNNTPQTMNLSYQKIWLLSENIDVIQFDDTGDTQNTFLIKQSDIKTSLIFINKINNLYTDIHIEIDIPEGETRTITYDLYEPAYSIRYYGKNNELLNVGNKFTPVYIENGQFYPCVNLKDVLIDTNNNNITATAVQEIWIDPDD